MLPDSNSTHNKNPSSASPGKKSSSSSKPQQASAQPHLNCPRCDSPNTKFCYYNNYSLSQPRHFCKTCRRYWTKGGALRNVPVGGGCRKNKKMRNLSSSRVSGEHSADSSVSSDQFGGLKFFHGVPPPVDFQLGGLLGYPRLQSPNAGGADLFHGQFASYAGLTTSNNNTTCGPSSFSLDPPEPNSSAFTGLSSFPLSAPRFQEMGSSSFNNSQSLASSIESLSSINQDLHWKLQQQRLAMLYVGEGHQKENTAAANNNTSSAYNSSAASIETLVQKPQPILFHSLETESCGVLGSSRKDNNSGGDNGTSTLATEWFFDNSLAASVNPMPATSGSNENNSTNWNSGIIQAWSDLSHYPALP